MAGAYARIEGHEALCLERHKSINAKLNGITGLLMAVVLGLFSWMAVQLYTLEPLRVAAAQHDGARP